MKINQFPRQEDVVEIGFGTKQVSVVTVTDENKTHLIEAVFSMYLGERCKYCAKKYKTLADLKGTVWAGEHKHGRLACGVCYSENNMVNTQAAKYEIDSKQAVLIETVKP